MKKHRKIIYIFIFGILLLSLGAFFLYKKTENVKLQKIKIQEEKELKLKKEKYSDYIKTTKKQNIYTKIKNKYNKVGMVEEDKTLSLEQTKINKETEYFKIKDSNYYISYKEIEKETKHIKDTRYKNYLPFNENVITKDKVKLYQNNELIFTLDFPLNKAVIEKSNEGYMIEFLDELYLVKQEDIKEIINNENTTQEEASNIPITVYHFIYLNEDTSCNEIICHSQKQIEEQFSYLKENKFLTITTKELEKYLDNNIRLPQKSILITIDDGARAQNFIPFLEKYEINATLFLITSWYDSNTFKSPYMEIASHTDNLHTPGICSGGQGSPLKCLETEKLVEDLIKSRNKLNQTEAFCFPFYEFNSHAIQAVKKAGFKLGFIGGGIKAAKTTDKYKIPRITILNTTTLEEYKKIVLP